MRYYSDKLDKCEEKKDYPDKPNLLGLINTFFNARIVP